jgi:hypothetical protein
MRKHESDPRKMIIGGPHCPHCHPKSARKKRIDMKFVREMSRRTTEQCRADMDKGEIPHPDTMVRSMMYTKNSNPIF